MAFIERIAMRQPFVATTLNEDLIADLVCGLASVVSQDRVNEIACAIEAAGYLSETDAESFAIALDKLAPSMASSARLMRKFARVRPSSRYIRARGTSRTSQTAIRFATDRIDFPVKNCESAFRPRSARRLISARDKLLATAKPTNV